MRPLCGSQKSNTFLDFLAVAALGAAIFLNAGSALASQHCQIVSRDEVAERLADRYSEHPIATAETAAGGTLEIFASEAGATWTVILWFEGWDKVCLMDSGFNWQDVPADRVKWFKPAGLPI